MHVTELNFITIVQIAIDPNNLPLTFHCYNW